LTDPVVPNIGEILNLQSSYLQIINYGVSAIGLTQAGYVTRSSLHGLAQNHPGIARAFWFDTLVDAAICREWMLGLGRRIARCYLAHLLRKMIVRFRAVLPVMEAAFSARVALTPLSSDDLAGALGLRRAEISCTLQDLQREILIRARVSGLEILNQEGLLRICSFDPTYLHQDRAA
jgi:CRP-like cAMP-binding protein